MKYKLVIDNFESKHDAEQARENIHMYCGIHSDSIKIMPQTPPPPSTPAPANVLIGEATQRPQPKFPPWSY